MSSPRRSCRNSTLESRFVSGGWQAAILPECGAARLGEPSGELRVGVALEVGHGPCRRVGVRGAALRWGRSH